jgi:hypothetical protein
MESKAASILIVGSEDFGDVAKRVLNATLAGENFVRSVSWEAATPIWSHRLFQETDLFVLELFRQYPTGFRPEGLITASLIVRKGARPLVVGPFKFPWIEKDSGVNSSSACSNWYWAVDDGASLTARASLAIRTTLSETDKTHLAEAAKIAVMDDGKLFVLHR